MAYFYYTNLVVSVKPLNIMLEISDKKISSNYLTKKYANVTDRVGKLKRNDFYVKCVKLVDLIQHFCHSLGSLGV